MKLDRSLQDSAQMVDLTEDNELQSSYLRGLAAKLDTLNLAKRELLSDSEEAAETLRRVAHQLKGSGATYGFPKISEAAESVEESELEEIYFNTNRLIEILKKVIKV